MNHRSAPTTILIVDDEPHVIHVLSVVLRHAGYRVLAASDGSEAIGVLAAHGVDLIISDVQMPSLDGIAMAAKLHQDERARWIPIVLLTGHGDLGDTRPTPNVRLVLGKPFSPRQVVLEITKIVPAIAPSQAQAA